MSGYDGDNDQDAETSESNRPGDNDALFKKLSRYVKRGWGCEAQTKWRKEAREDFAFEAGDQLSAEDKQILKDANRPIVIFNRVGAYIDSVSGQEISNRQQVQFLPRTQGAVKVNELLTSAASWFRQQCDAEDEESDAFRDMVVCGMGWTETRLNYEENPNGEPLVDHLDPLQMGWDPAAKKRNLRDRRFQFQIRENVPLDEAKALCPGDGRFEDSDYDASWVRDIGAKPEGEAHENDGRFYNKENLTAEEDDDDDGVTLVRIQWWERVPAFLTADPSDPTGKKIKVLAADEHAQLVAQAQALGVPMPRVVKSTRKVYRQAYLGSVLLESGDAPCKGHFSFQCMTAKRDRATGMFYGMVRAMKDPARWANKWMSQTMHIMNTSAKGGIAVEEGQFFKNDAAGEASWARNDKVTKLKAGALSGQNPKFIQKPTSELPNATVELMNVAISALPAVTGVNLESLGMQQNSGQAASLDLQRKQAVLMILQPLFDALRRYRKTQGRVLMYLIEHYLSDGRLIKIEGDDEAQYVPLIREQAFSGNSEYDVIVDEAPTSANQKEQTWAMLQQLLPVIGKMLPPATWLALLKYSPLPTSAQKDISDSIQQAGQQPDPEQQKRDAELKLKQDSTQADIAGHQAVTAAKIDGMHATAVAKMQIEANRAHAKTVQEGAVAALEQQQQAAQSQNDNQQIMQAIGDLQQQVASLVQAIGSARAPVAGPTG